MWFLWWAITSKESVSLIIVPLSNIIVDKYVVGHSTLNVLFFLGPIPIVLLLTPLTILPVTFFAGPNRLTKRLSSMDPYQLLAHLLF